jgi:phage shock protein E
MRQRPESPTDNKMVPTEDHLLRPQRFVPNVVLLIVVLATAAFLAGCGSDDDGTAEAGSDVPSAGQDAAAAALESERVVIDVRTPEEYAVSHVDGAELIDVQGPDFDAFVADLDPEGEYVVYCRSGNRSATAAASMTATGLDVWDGGGLTDMEAAGWPTSTG